VTMCTMRCDSSHKEGGSEEHKDQLNTQGMTETPACCISADRIYGPIRSLVSF
jgi:hypothetical protein